MRRWQTSLVGVTSWLALACLPQVVAAQSETRPARQTIRVLPTAGYLVFGDYFSGPSGIQFSNESGLAYGGELGVTVSDQVELIGSVLHGTSDWSFEKVPFLGTVTVGGASLWFIDAGVRGELPLGRSRRIAPFLQLSAGLIRYAVNNAILSDHANNFTWSGGVGIKAQLGERLTLEGLVKDYVSSFKSVDDAANLGIVGRRAHTLGFLIGLGVGW